MPMYMTYNGKFFDLIHGHNEMIVRASNILIRTRILFFPMVTKISSYCFIFPLRYRLGFCRWTNISRKTQTVKMQVNQKNDGSVYLNQGHF